MSILVTGANGLVGRALLNRLLGDGKDVVGSVRRNPQAHQILVDDINESTDWRAALAGREIVIHAAARVHQMLESGMQGLEEFRRVNVAGTLNLARQATASGVRRIVFISSVKAVGELGVFHSDDPCHPQDAYGISKREAELGLLALSAETGMEVTIVRPPLVYGPGVGANFLRLIRMVERGIPLPFALARNTRSLVALDNLVDAILTCATHPAAAGRIYLPSDGQDISTSGLIREIAVALDRPANLLPIPLFLMRVAARLMGKRALSERLFGSLVVDSEPLRKELGWTPVCTLQQGMRKTMDWYQHERTQA